MRPQTTPILQVLLLLISLSVLAFPSTARAQGDPLIDTRSVTTGQNFNAQTYQNLPVGRDPAELLSQAPGVQTGEPLRPSGMTGSENLYTIDGIAIGDPAALGGSGAYTEFDLIQEVQVQTGGASAEYGQSAGGVVNVVTKAGSKEWRGTGRFLVGEGDANGVGALTNPGFQIDVAQDAAGGYCLQGFQVTDGGTPVATAAGSRSPVQIGLDVPFTMGMGAGAGSTFGAGRRGDLNLSQIPGCAGQPNGMTFVDTPGFVTPPTPTHMFFGENGVYAVDMGRIGSLYGLPDKRGSTPYQLEDTHIFNSNFYLTGMTSYVNGGFQLAPQAGGQAAGVGQGFFVYGIDAQPGASEQPTGLLPKWDFYSIRLRDAPARLPDANGDGHGDSYFVALANLTPGCQNTVGGAFKAGAGGAGGGSLEADPGAFKVDCGYLQERYGDWTLNVGLRYDDFKSEGDAQEYVSPFSGDAQEPSQPRLEGVIPPEIRYAGEFAGFRIAEKAWIYGEYDTSSGRTVESDEPLASLFSESFYGRAANYNSLFTNDSYTLAPVRRAGKGLRIQDIGLEIRSLERASVPGEDGPVPGGAVDGDSHLQGLADELDSPLIYVVANGGPTGDVFQVQVVQPASGAVAINGIVAVEPVAATDDDREDFERELARMPGTKEILTAAGYCLNQDLLAPPAGTVYRVSPAARQAAFEPMRRVLDAGRRLRDAGRLNPDSDATDYYHSIRQWAVWSVEKGFDREAFLESFVEQTEKHFRESGQPWSADVAAAVRSYGEGRWADIKEILDAAEAAP
ncbi:MAG TPA: TonB-dependent receptor [Gemmatimonadota bacterium]|nr:TonB-dependent receptor [Gemmatimonadota bacterium]